MDFRFFRRFYEYNGDRRLRVSGVQATDVILPFAGTPRDGTVQPLALYASSGAVAPRPLHTDRGHLVGLQFGGPENPGNLVPMYGGFNSAAGAWGRQFETPLRDHLNTFGTAVNLEIAVFYADTTTPIPNQFRVTVVASRGAALPPSLAVPLLLPHTPPTAFHMEPHDFMYRAGFLLQTRQEQMEAACWSVELQGVSAGRLETLQVGGLNPGSIDFAAPAQKAAFYAARPYAVLDFLYFNFPTEYRQLGGPHLAGGINNVSEFTADQVRFILQMNVVKYRGYMDSDLFGITPHEEIRHLMPASTDFQGQVDHSMARSGAGSNAYSNARVISARLNKALNNALVNQAVDQSLKTLAGI